MACHLPLYGLDGREKADAEARFQNQAGGTGMGARAASYAFEMLYWCGIREGELLALTPADFDFEKGTVTISKSYQRLNQQDIVTSPKTEKSNRTIVMPQFLSDEMKDFLKSLYGIQPDSRIFMPPPCAPIGPSSHVQTAIPPPGRTTQAGLSPT